jgi:molybdenum cofactor cytidylyltransferase
VLISQALRLQTPDIVNTVNIVTIVGGGGKTTLMFRLAEELAGSGRHVVTTMTTRIFASQMQRAPAFLVLHDEQTLLDQLPPALDKYRHVLVAGNVRVEIDKVAGIPPALAGRIAALPGVDALIIEADGSRRLPFKAPAAHEPVVPPSTTILIPVVGIDVLGRALDAEHVHRPQIVAELAGATLGGPVTPEIVAAVIAHPAGGAKDLPPGARLVPFLNKVESAETLSAARALARLLLAYPQVDSVIIGAAQAAEPVSEVWSRVGAVVLAAGGASRYGELKQLLPWGDVPLVAHVAEQALACQDVTRVAVTLGAGADGVHAALTGAALGAADVIQVPVPDWAAGQSRSVRAGLEALRDGGAPPLGGILFLLADQPGVSPALLAALIRRHRETLAPVVAPRYHGQRGNPVLFDRVTFAEFARLEGDIGARPILQAHAGQIAWLDWPTPEIIEDIDTPADYAPPA